MNQSPILLLAAALGALALSACQPKTAAPAADSSPPVANVNGEPITRDFYEFYIKGITSKSSAELTPEQRGRALDNLIHARLVAQQAAKEGLDKNGDTPYLLALSRLNVLQQAVSDHYLKDKQPTDAQLHAEYDTQVAGMSKTEYHARHILVATEPFAEKVIGRLQKGEKFEDLAKAESMDSSKNSGGDLGWFTPDRMLPEFVHAVEGLKPGEYTKKPVQTQYGWHVIQLVDTRPLTPPPFDQVKQRLEQVVQAKKFKLYVDDLMRTAQITKTLDQSAGASRAAGSSGISAAPAPAASGTPPAAPRN
ncbi:MAG: peptidylprolyl isomerase [Steroidobacteraceae bacterium]